jgi:hypothetical protein
VLPDGDVVKKVGIEFVSRSILKGAVPLHELSRAQSPPRSSSNHEGVLWLHLSIRPLRYQGGIVVLSVVRAAVWMKY